MDKDFTSFNACTQPPRSGPFPTTPDPGMELLHHQWIQDKWLEFSALPHPLQAHFRHWLRFTRRSGRKEDDGFCTCKQGSGFEAEASAFPGFGFTELDSSAANVFWQTGQSELQKTVEQLSAPWTGKITTRMSFLCLWTSTRSRQRCPFHLRASVAFILSLA